jgi:hypothetical protein
MTRTVLGSDPRDIRAFRRWPRKSARTVSGVTTRSQSTPAGANDFAKKGRKKAFFARQGAWHPNCFALPDTGWSVL